ncbi:unnamed protein product [Toxocara canis]|uniref:Uncharacterized protein n=1 Tax=Toxocara canis TaxID=6265 RepID=A0A183UDT0_TOXCA|nr:unnamed protein product [Toxocara canis]
MQEKQNLDQAKKIDFFLKILTSSNFNLKDLSLLNENPCLLRYVHWLGCSC